MVMNRRNDIEVVDGATTYSWPLMPTSAGGKAMTVATRPWQEGDPMKPWREKLDLTQGLGGLSSGAGYYTKGPVDLIGDMIVPGPYPRQVNGSKIKWIHTKSTTASAATSIVATAPTGTLENDYVLAFVNLSDVQADVTATGWTVLKRQDGTTGSFHILRRFVASSPASDYTFSWLGSAATIRVDITAWEHVDTSTPEDQTDFTVTDTYSGSPNAATLTSPTIATGSPGGKALMVIMEPDTVTAPVITGDNLWEWTNREEHTWTVMETNSDVSGDVNNTAPALTLTGAGGAGNTVALGLIVLNPDGAQALSAGPGAGAVRFDNKLFFNGTNDDVWYIDEYGVMTFDADLDADFSLSNMQQMQFVVFENELIAFSEVASKKISKRGAGNRVTWTQASDNTYGHVAAVVNDKLWRVVAQNKVSSCLTTPFTLTNWTPASANEYNVGDTEYYPVGAIEYDGSFWVAKHDGVYAPNNQFEFINQTPQLRRSPHFNNGHNLFNAKGYLWVPHASGILRVTIGEAIEVSPAKSGSPSLNWFVMGGAEIDGNVYLWTTSQDWRRDVVRDAVIKLVEAEDGGYRYYSVAEPMESTADGGITGLGAATTNFYDPGILASSSHRLSTIHNILSGDPIPESAGKQYLTPILVVRGRTDVDGDVNTLIVTDNDGYKDSLYYPYATRWAFETPYINPVGDKSTPIILQGIEVTARLASAQTLDFTYGADGAAIDQSFYADGEASSSGQLTNLTNIVSTKLYTALSTDGVQCNTFRLGMVGANTNPPDGTTRPEIHQVVSFGWMQPENTDYVTVQIIIDPNAKINGIKTGDSVTALRDLFRTWKNDGKVRAFKLPDYEEANNTYFKVGDYAEETLYVSQSERVLVANVELIRVNYKDNYAA